MNIAAANTYGMNTKTKSADPASLKFEMVQTAESKKYILSSRVEILFILRELMRKGALITAYFNDGSDYLLTTLLAVEDNGTLLLDYGADAEMNQKALASEKVVFIANHDKVKVQFSRPNLQPVNFEGRPAFRTTLPESVMRLQRREYYRLTTPSSRPVKCLIPVHTEKGPLRDVEAMVLDISNGGVAVIAPPDGLTLKVGSTLADCRIVIPDMGTIFTSIQVKNMFDVTLKNGTHVRRAGCQFSHLDGAAMALVQRYIIRVERDRRARETGLT